MSTPALRLLVIEDNAVLRANLDAIFAERGIEATFAADGMSGLQQALSDPPDVLVLDLGLPGLDGLRVCERVRERADRHVPILMLTARDTLDDKLLGFRSGADDYLVKPFSSAELLARCQALSLRHRAGASHLLRIGSLCIDRRSGLAQRAGRTLSLQHTARRILLALAEAWPRTLTRSELADRVWGEAPPRSDPLRTHLYLLRRALDRPFATPMLKTVHGVGFRLDPDT